MWLENGYFPFLVILNEVCPRRPFLRQFGLPACIQPRLNSEDEIRYFLRCLLKYLIRVNNTVLGHINVPNLLNYDTILRLDIVVEEPLVIL